jgi:hypothetical protein
MPIWISEAGVFGWVGKGKWNRKRRKNEGWTAPLVMAGVNLRILRALRFHFSCLLPSRSLTI